MKDMCVACGHAIAVENRMVVDAPCYAALQTELATLRQERDKAYEMLECVLTEKPIHGGSGDAPEPHYVHLAYCNSLGNDLPGTPGKTCCCLRSRNAALSELAAIKERYIAIREKVTELIVGTACISDNERHEINGIVDDLQQLTLTAAFRSEPKPPSPDKPWWWYHKPTCPLRSNVDRGACNCLSRSGKRS